MWRMRVVHATGYAYKSPVTASFNEARLTPRSDSRQNVILNRVETAPATRSYRYVDYWGTAVTAFEVYEPHADLTVTAFRYDPETGKLDPIQTIPTVEERQDGYSTAEVRVHPSGKFLYGSNRGHDSIAMFSIDESTGDLLFSSTAPLFRTELLLSRDITSRTYSFYYPRTRPEGRPRCLIVSSTNANYDDWATLNAEEYEASKRDLVETTLDALDKYVPNIRERLDHVEASTPVTFKHYTQHVNGASFGTKFEGLAVSRALPQQVRGLYHAGSVGIIMSGWLGAMNYGVIVANEVDSQLMSAAAQTPALTQ